MAMRSVQKYIQPFLLIAVILAAVFLASRVPSAPSDTHKALVGPPVISYTVSGKQILKNGTTPFLPYGVQLGGITMAVPSWATNDSSTLTLNEIRAAQDTWHSNTVSLQLASVNLSTAAPAGSYLPPGTSYLSRVDQIVDWATNQNMNIILVLQYEGINQQPFPTQDSIDFWSVISQRYASNPRVFFDVFNEPRIPNNGDDTPSAWSLWRNGGTLNGVLYVGMQQLVETIRANAQNTLIFVDGLAAGEDIHLLPNNTLSGSNIVYAIHPYLGDALHGDPTHWDVWFGNATSSGTFPVVADEWSEYQNPNDGECYAQAAQTVPTFLSYLSHKGIGLIGYALYPGTLIRGWNFSTPTQFDQPTYDCNPPGYTFPNVSPAAQGAGLLLMGYFQAYSKPL